MLITLESLVKKYAIKIKGIIHIGAHYCEERESYNNCGVTDDKIIWIEGQKKVYDAMKESNKNIKIYNALISDTNDKEVELIVTSNSQSSSILELDEHK